MRTPAVFSALIFSAFSFAAVAQTQAKTPTNDAYKNEAIVLEKYETAYRMNADGTGERDVYSRIRIQSQGAAQQFGVLAFSYAAANETPQIKFVRVHKADGSVVETPTSDAIDMPAAVSREAPLYSDLKEKHIPVRSLSPGDTLEYEVDTTINKSDAPGQFWGATHFTVPGSLIVLSEVLTLEVPTDKYVQVWSPNHKPVVTEQSGVKTYRWDVAQLVPAPKSTGSDDVKPPSPKDPDEDADRRKLPSVAWTTFHSWAELGDWYRSLALAEAQPNDAVRAKADEITKTAKTPDEQMRAIYDFVSMHIRYVGIDFGIGRYKPHAAAEVLANQYGDCKDKDTLLEALLRARGFSTSPALIGAGIAPVPDVPSPAVFNHVITTVNQPSGRIWLDSTPEGAPYRMLIPQIRDEQALVVSSDGIASLQRTPLQPPFPYFNRFEATGALDKDGLLKSRIDMTIRSDDEFAYRMLLQRIAPSQWDEAMQAVSRAMGFSGTVSNTDMTQQDPVGPLHISYNYTRSSFADWDNHRILPLFPTLEITYIDKNNAPEQDIDQGEPRTLEAITHIKLPDGYSADLPESIHVKRDYATFDQTYRLSDNELIVDRKAVILKKKVAKANWKDYYAYTKALGAESGENYISLIPTQTASPNASVASAPTPGAGYTASQQAAQLEYQTQQMMLKAMMKEARELELEGHWDAAQAMLMDVKSKNPDQPYVMSMLGYIAKHDEKWDEAIRDYETEVKHPEVTSNIVTQLAYLYVSQKRYSDAEALLHKYLERNDEILFVALANAQINSGDNSAALTTLHDALATHPGDPSMETLYAEALHRDNRDKESAAMAKLALLGPGTAGILNSNAYLLSELDQDLPLAERASRHSIEIQEVDTAQVTATGKVNGDNLSQTNLLFASWDTLGWIYFREGKLDTAKPWLVGAWRASLSAEVGDHLGQLYEAAGEKDEAATTYALAQTAIDKTTSPDAIAHIKERIEKLRAAGAKLGPSGTEALQNQRTYSVPCPTGVSGQGSFRLIITNAGVIESQQMTGEQKIAGIKPAFAKLKLDGLVPMDSKAHLLRSAVVSCSSKSSCQVVLVPDGGLQTEQP